MIKRSLLSVSDFVLFSNIFMSFCAVAQGLVTFYLIGATPVLPVIFLLFTATLLIYNFSILYPRPAKPDRSPQRRIRYFFRHYKLMLTLTILAFLCLIPLFILLSNKSEILLILLGIISFCYSIPLFTLGNKKLGLRSIPGLKPIMIILVWTLSTVLIPVIEAHSLHSTTISIRDTIILIAMQFLFIGALTIPFDIRDFFEDKQSGLKTIPVVLGEKNAYTFCQVMLTGYIILLFIFKDNGLNHNFWVLSITAVLTGWLIFKSKWEKNEYYYFFYMDGVLILQYLMLLLFNKL